MSLPRVFASTLGRRFVLLIVLFSSFFTLIASSVQLFMDYNEDVTRVNSQVSDIERSYLNTITLSLWSLDEDQLAVQLQGLSTLPDIEWVAITADGRVEYEAGSRPASEDHLHTLPLIYESSRTEPITLGQLHIAVNINNIYNRLLYKAGVILFSNALKTFAVSGFILILIYVLVTRPLTSIADYLSQLSVRSIDQPLRLNHPRHTRKKDEIDSVVENLNIMRNNLNVAIEHLQATQQELRQLLKERDRLLEMDKIYNEQLELLVTQRTRQVEQSLADVKAAQESLVEKEKMAALGDMVAGIAHEINTPIGVCRTAASVQSDGVASVREKMEQGTLTQSDLTRFLDDVEEASSLFDTNIIKASELISNFKLISTDQSHDTIHTFNLNEYIHSSIQTIFPQIKKQNITFNIDVPDEIELTTYPGAIHQVLTNLILNSANHGFNQQSGEIGVSATLDEGCVLLRYQDSGRGLSDEERLRIFEPFYTTKRGKGGSGLGMSIVYNIVTKQLQGRLKLGDGDGFNLSMRIPKTLDAEQDSG